MNNEQVKWLKYGIIFLLAALISYFIASQVLAVAPPPYKVICHHNPSQNVTLSFQNVQSYNGHLGTPHNDMVYDTEGACVEPTNTPTPTLQPSATPTPTIVLCDGQCEPTPTPTEVTPTPTREPEITPVVVQEQPRDTNNTTSTPSCPVQTPIGVSDIWVENPVQNDGKLTVRWGTNESYPRVHIRYSEVDGQWRYALLNSLNDGSEEIGGLTNGVHYFFQVAYVDSCAVGNYSNSFDPTP